MALSVNTYFIQMIEDIGICPVTRMADKLGVVTADGQKLKEVPAISLGTEGMSPLTMANAYATFANRGTYCTPVFIESVTTAQGKSLPVPKSSCSRAMSERTADTINTLLMGVVDSGTGREAGLTSRDNAGKTGTTDSRHNAWFVGYTPNLSGAVWVGAAGAEQVSMENITIGGVYHPKVYGGQVPGPIWKDAMSGALDGEPAPDFNTVHIPKPEKDKKDKDDRDEGDDNKPSDSRPGDDDGDSDRGRGRGNGGGRGGNGP